MEKPTFCGMKQRSVKQMHEFKVKVAAFECGSDYGSNLGERDLVAGGFSWPPRSYVCSFCKREFRSAQALGGHMNVHRRDRARLRQSPTRDGGGGNCNGNGNNSSSSNGNGNGTQFSVLNLNLEPNPNYYSNPNSSPNYFPPSPPRVSPFLTKFPQLTSKLPPLGAGDAAPVHNRRPATTDFMRFEPLKKGCEGFKNPEFVRLDLEIGLMSRPSKEELDLELRLGYT